MPSSGVFEDSYSKCIHINKYIFKETKPLNCTQGSRVGMLCFPWSSFVEAAVAYQLLCPAGGTGDLGQTSTKRLVNHYPGLQSPGLGFLHLFFLAFHLLGRAQA